MINNTTRDIGKFGEDFAAKKLYELGLSVERMNYTEKGGEIDIIAVENDEIAFIEVKVRMVNSLQSPIDAITKTKQKNIIKTAKKYLDKFEPNYYPRFDVFLIIISNINNNIDIANYEYIRNAFWE